MDIKPTIGRVLYFHPQETDPGYDASNDPLAAIVAGIQNETRINLAVFDRQGRLFSRTGVVLLQG